MCVKIPVDQQLLKYSYQPNWQQVVEEVYLIEWPVGVHSDTVSCVLCHSLMLIMNKLNTELYLLCPPAYRFQQWLESYHHVHWWKWHMRLLHQHCKRSTYCLCCFIYCTYLLCHYNQAVSYHWTAINCWIRRTKAVHFWWKSNLEIFFMLVIQNILLF